METEDIPEYEVTSGIMRKIFDVERLLVSIDYLSDKRIIARLRKESRIKSVSSSLAIEGNELGPFVVRDIINGKNVEGPFDEILEIKNAINAYRDAEKADPWSIEDFLMVAEDMMFGLVEHDGYRRYGTGVFEGDVLRYKAPEYELVPAMMDRLFEWGRRSESHPLVKAAVVHYYIEAIHPFEDCNGRMGRLWHSVILNRFDRSFGMVPVESGIRAVQDDYYRVISKCDELGDCTRFIDLMLDVTIRSLKNVLHALDPNMRRLLEAMESRPMTMKEIMDAMGLRDRANVSRLYIRPALEYGLIEMTEPPRSPKQRYRRILE